MLAINSVLLALCIAGGPGGRQPAPAPTAVWPWPHAVSDKPYDGVTHWIDTSSSDGTTLDLFDFDFSANPKLRLEMYDQDEDDAVPLDNTVLHWNMGVGQAVAHLNTLGRGPVIAAWNGLFFDPNGNGPDAVAVHLTPVVLGGKLRYSNLPTYRWTFGVHSTPGGQQFVTSLMPKAKDLPAMFDYAAGAAQCLVRNGAPLKLEPFPSRGAPEPASHACANDEAGYIPNVDHRKVSRTSIGWSKDFGHLYLLCVTEPTINAAIAATMRQGLEVSGGWTLADVQRFWFAKGVWGAINSDGGPPEQFTYRLNSGDYLLSPAQWASDGGRIECQPDFANAPHGGALMYFYVREVKKE